MYVYIYTCMYKCMGACIMHTQRSELSNISRKIYMYKISFNVFSDEQHCL